MGFKVTIVATILWLILIAVGAPGWVVWAFGTVSVLGLVFGAVLLWALVRLFGSN